MWREIPPWIICTLSPVGLAMILRQWMMQRGQKRAKKVTLLQLAMTTTSVSPTEKRAQSVDEVRSIKWQKGEKFTAHKQQQNAFIPCTYPWTCIISRKDRFRMRLRSEETRILNRITNCTLRRPSSPSRHLRWRSDRHRLMRYWEPANHWN